MIELINLTIIQGRCTLKDINLIIPQGKYAVLTGQTGSGKSTLLETIAGLFAPEKGKVIIGDQEVTDWSPAKRCLGYLPQEASLFSHMNVADHLAFALRLRKLSTDKITERVNQLARDLEISSLLTREIKNLSGGEQQRVALGRAISAWPKVLLLDEPLAALDPKTREHIQKLLLHICKENKMTVLHVTHWPDSLKNRADLCCHIQNQRIACQ